MSMHKNLEKLAIFGGKPKFDETLHVGRPNIGNRERFLDRLNDILDRKWLTNRGPYELEFEQRIAEFVGVNNCIAMCNGTVALEITSRALGMTGEVIVPSFTFVATAHALQWQGSTPVFCDIDPENYTIDPEKIESLITPRTTGIIGVHLWGRICNIERITEIARRHNLKLMFDACHAFACSYKGKMSGGFGDAEVLSFHATKFLNTFEGGAVVTNDDDLASKIRLMKNFGFVGLDDVGYVGTNGKMNEVSAAMGLTSLESIERIITTNHRNYKKYQTELSKVPGVKVLAYDESEKCNYQYIVLEIDDSISGINRDDLAKVLYEENILSRRYFYPGCHNFEPYRSYFPNARLLLPKTESCMKKVLSLPTGTAVGLDNIKQICGIIKFAVKHGREINERLCVNKKKAIAA